MLWRCARRDSSALTYDVESSAAKSTLGAESHHGDMLARIHIMT